MNASQLGQICAKWKLLPGCTEWQGLIELPCRMARQECGRKTEEETVVWGGRELILRIFFK